MKITYIKLVNVAGLMVGSNKNELEISFKNSKNKIIAIQGPNGVGKTVLLSSLSPFSGVTSLDERSTLSYIREKKDGYKEIHYDINGDKYIIKHYYKAAGKSHSVKSYISKNGEELNENGNVRSFIALVETHFGLTEEMMRLIRLGTNVNSFISLTPARRKEYIGKLIEEIDGYLMIYKDINEQLRAVKMLQATNSSNLYKCHISDIVVEEENLSKLAKEIKKHEKEKDDLLSKITRINTLMSSNNVEELRKKKQDAEAQIREFNKTEEQVKEMSLTNTTVEDLIKRKSSLSEERIAVQSKINSYRISIDNALKTIERLELSVKKVTSDNDVQSLINMISSLEDAIRTSAKILNGFVPANVPSEDLQFLIMKLNSFNQIAQMIYTFGNRPIDVYIKLVTKKESVDRFIKDQLKKNVSRINENDIKMLIDQVFADEDIITPNCESEFTGCPYYRLSEVIYKIKDRLDEEVFDDETLRYIQVISNNIDNIMNELDRFRYMKIPDGLKVDLKSEVIIKRLSSKVAFFDVNKFQEYLTLVKEYELLCTNHEKLKEYKRQLSVYKKSGVDSQINEIKELEKSIEFYRNNIDVLSKDLERINEENDKVDEEISVVSKFNDSKKYKQTYEDIIKSTGQLLEPLESASNELVELQFQMRQITNLINITRQNHKELEMKITEYKRLLEEAKKLEVENFDLNMILESVSTKKGIPVIYMKKYLGKIKRLANNLLKLIYDEEFQLAKFNISPDAFEVPYIKNGVKVADIKYASQSECALSTMALSFALNNKASKAYNILLLDEADSGLDEDNRILFFKMVYMQMSALKAEQSFIISQNINQMVNIPMDCIRLGETSVNSKLQHVIYSV